VFNRDMQRFQLLTRAWLLGRVVAVVASVGGVAEATSGCAGGIDVPVQPLLEVQRFDSGFATPRRFIVRDPDSWAALWPQIIGTLRPTPPAPVVDFTHDVVVVAAMGSKPTNGYEIDVEAVRLYADGAAISVREQSPAPECTVADHVTSPITAVLVPRFTGTATFAEHSAQVGCR
jgi:hypothetical protein